MAKSQEARTGRKTIERDRKEDQRYVLHMTVYGSTKSRRIRQLLVSKPPEWICVLEKSWDRLVERPREKAISDSDLIILVPDLGIVYLEVKEGLIEMRDNVYFQTNRKSGFTKQIWPLQQAQDSQDTLDKKLGKKLGIRIEKAKTGALTSFSGVWFPDVEGPGPHSALPFDVTPIAYGGIEVLRAEIDRLPRLSAPITSELMDRLIATLAPSHVFPVTNGATSPTPTTTPEVVKAEEQSARRAEQDLEEVTQLVTTRWLRWLDQTGALATVKQSEILDKVLDDETLDQRVVEIVGAAGTGKTLLAAQLALLLSQRGEEVLLTCRRTSMTKWLKETVSRSQMMQKQLGVELNRKSPEVISLEHLALKSIESVVGQLPKLPNRSFVMRLGISKSEDILAEATIALQRARELGIKWDPVLTAERKVQQLKNTIDAVKHEYRLNEAEIATLTSQLKTMQSEGADDQEVEELTNKISFLRDEFMAIGGKRKPQVQSHLPKYSVIIVDESQDISSAWQAPTKEMISPNGMIIFAGDPTQKDVRKEGLAARDLFSRTQTFFLDKNCRNTRNIFFTSIARTPSIHSEVEAVGPQGPQVHLVKMESRKPDILKQIRMEVQELREGIVDKERKNDIFIVLPRGFLVDMDEVRTSVQSIARWTFDVLDRKHLFVGTPFDVKGFERRAAVVVATKTQTLSDFYTACSRACLELTLLVDDPLFKTLSVELSNGVVAVETERRVRNPVKDERNFSGGETFSLEQTSNLKKVVNHSGSDSRRDEHQWRSTLVLLRKSRHEAALESPESATIDNCALMLLSIDDEESKLYLYGEYPSIPSHLDHIPSQSNLGRAMRTASASGEGKYFDERLGMIRSFRILRQEDL